MDYRGATATTVEIQVLNRKSAELSGASVFNRGFRFLKSCAPLSVACDQRTAETIVDRASLRARADTRSQTLSNQLFVGHRDCGAATEAPVEAGFDKLHAVAMSKNIVVQIARVVLAEAHVEIFELDRPA